MASELVDVDILASTGAELKFGTINNSSLEGAWRQSLLAPYYAALYHLFNENDALMSSLVTYFLILTIFWGLGGLFLIVDLTGRPSFIAKYKVQQEKAEIDREKLKKVIRTVFFNNVVLNAIFAYPSYRAQAAVGCSFIVEDTPTWVTIVVDLALCTIVQEIVFYYSHRLFHVPLLYQYVHRTHHQWTAPIGIVCIYTSATEYLTGNGLSVFLGPLLCRSHIVTWWIWQGLAQAVTIIHHSGYHLPGFPSPQFHDFHHLTFKWNYGTLGLLDWLHGTDKQFLKVVQLKRHRTFWSATPMHQRYPADTGKGEVQTTNGKVEGQKAAKAD